MSKDQKVPTFTGTSAAPVLSQHLWNQWLDFCQVWLPQRLFCFHNTAYQVGIQQRCSLLHFYFPSLLRLYLMGRNHFIYRVLSAKEPEWCDFYFLALHKRKYMERYNIAQWTKPIVHKRIPSIISYKFRLEILTIGPESWTTISREIIIKYTYLLLGSILIVCLYLLYQLETPNSRLSARI